MNEITTTKAFFSVVVPVYNEVEAVASLHAEILQIMQTMQKPFEIIFVDDGSRDGTFEKLQSLHPITIIRLRKNFGQTAALDAGFKHAQGEIIFTLDGDGQNDPADIPGLYAKIEEGYDVVSGWRKNRKDTFSKRFLSRGANFLRGFLVADKIKDSGCTLKAYRRECFEDLDLFGEIHRFIPAILAWKGFRIGEIVVNHRARTTGRTKYNWRRVIKGFVDMVSVWFWRKYSSRPLHLFGGLGILAGAAGLVLGLYLAIARLMGIISLQNSIWPLISVFLILAGIQLFISGLLGDIAIKTYYNGKRQIYTIRSITTSRRENS
ncbi:MAG: glycosyltransferase [Candidatus Nomurabacteria bacterium]|nr:MAG: glycosyltransferase [Candidatus Nomurabacteria bacterium]